MDHPKTVYVTYIATTAERLWQALTQAEFTTRYFFGLRVESDWRVGSPLALYRTDGELHVTGEVIECDPPRRLAYTWNVVSLAKYRNLPRTEVTYELESLGEVVRLTMTERHEGLRDERLLEGGRRGWPVILCNLKTLLETGQALPPFDMSFQQQAAAEMAKLLEEEP
jgi:uncharacterized protein YndB with AHSA1/START domain